MFFLPELHDQNAVLAASPIRNHGCCCNLPRARVEYRRAIAKASELALLSIDPAEKSTNIVREEVEFRKSTSAWPRNRRVKIMAASVPANCGRMITKNWCRLVGAPMPFAASSNDQRTVHFPSQWRNTFGAV
jgi:hypothetical protein